MAEHCTDADVDLLGRAFAKASGDDWYDDGPLQRQARYRAGARLMLRALVAAGWHRACPDLVPTHQYKASATVGTVGETGAAGPVAAVHTGPAPTRGGAIGPLPFEARDMPQAVR